MKPILSAPCRVPSNAPVSNPQEGALPLDSAVSWEAVQPVPVPVPVPLRVTAAELCPAGSIAAKEMFAVDCDALLPLPRRWDGCNCSG